MTRFGTAASPAVSARTTGLAELLVNAFSTRWTQALLLQTLVRQRETEQVEAALAELGDQDYETGELRITLAGRRLAKDDPMGATVALAPVLDGSAPIVNPGFWLTQAFLLEAIARDALGDAVAAERAFERALELAEPDGIVLPLVLHPRSSLGEDQRGDRTAHAALLSEILDVLDRTMRSRLAEPERLREPLTESEIRVLRYLPTNLSQPEIADELSRSVNTINTHIRHLYTKLGAHRRREAVERARGLGLLAPFSLQR